MTTAGAPFTVTSTGEFTSSSGSEGFLQMGNGFPGSLGNAYVDWLVFSTLGYQQTYPKPYIPIKQFSNRTFAR